MHRHGIAEVANDPLAKPLGFIGIVVFAGDHQVGDLEPNVRFVFEPIERSEHRIEMREGQFVIEAFAESFEIDVGGVDMPKDFRPGLGRNVAGGDHDAFEPAFTRHMRNVDDKLAPDHRIIIGEGDRGHAVFERELDDLFGADLKTLRLVKLGLADAPVLTKAAAQVATGRAEAQDFASR